MRFIALCAMFALALGSAGAAFAQSSPASAPTANADQELQRAFSAMSSANVTAMMNASDAMKAQQEFQQAFQAWRTAQQGRETSMQRQLASVNRALESERKTELAMRGRLQAAELQADQNAHGMTTSPRSTFPSSRPPSRIPTATNGSGAGAHLRALREPNYGNTGPNPPPQWHQPPSASASSMPTSPTVSRTGPHPVRPQSHPQGEARQ